ncbi:response regulator transcription factor [Phaeobacter sp.]|uniref:response regulator transcription factor n=1 Tax=Phaeobacter sp. TaxID=1902409 RepID=UPI0025FBCCE8|nr:response regulator transcription factor [Phaeobacter sp.]
MWIAVGSTTLLAIGISKTKTQTLKWDNKQLQASPPQKQRASIIVADDQILLLDTLKFAIEARGFQVVPCRSGRDRMAAVTSNGVCKEMGESAGISVVLMSTQMADLNGVRSLAEVLRRAPPRPVVLLVNDLSDHVVHQARELGVREFVSRRSSLTTLCETLTRASAAPGQCSLRPLPDPAVVRGCSDLSEREMAIGQMIARGLSNKLIAYEIGLSETTVKMHIRSLFEKMDASNRAQVAAVFLQRKMVNGSTVASKPGGPPLSSARDAQRVGGAEVIAMP